MRRILIKKDLEELTAAAAELFARLARESVEAQGAFSVALSGGSTPRGLYSLLASDEYRTAIDWRRVKFFFSDERNVPHDAPESNYRMAHETLFAPLGIEPANVVRWQTELADVIETADLYDRELRANRLDLVLLGLGADAHTASLFPNTAALKETEKLAVANWVEKLDAHRLTITFPAINRAANVIFLVAGREKADAVAKVLEGEYDPEESPAQNVKPDGGSLYWLLDQAAAGLLTTA